ncbi:Bdr family repetitive protein [Borreliella burgdorferi]|uniref:Repeat motif-containing protein n=1 Tax=Borreliella burgdorferi (strain ZS7) TaxID=445985 RepID=A0A0H3C3E0_BORBZ|nr:Bdr family repetitive protein [Borreliella burgdorferi]ACK74386.1 repeat motif-containing protein [Borreliella burgdorferi ZS7]MCS2182005.1 Bdr family repetitive protein [Borreliella burgdorferi]MCS2182030.1 Bdr family repetitive protein [Borreliella burgdorferi]
MKAVLATTNITEDQIYREFLRLGMEQLIAQDLSKRYYHNELTYRDLENLEKQFGIRFENLISEISFLEKNLQKDTFNLDAKIDSVEKNLQKDIFNLDAKIDSVEKNLQKDIFNLDAKIDSVEKNLQKDIFNLDAKIDSVEKNLQKDIFNLAQALKKEVQINSQFLLEKLKVSNRIIIIITVIIVPIAISSITNIVMLLIAKFFK